MFYRCSGELSRTLYLVTLITFTLIEVLKVFWDFEKDMPTGCIPFFGLFLLFWFLWRLIFAWARSVTFKYCLSLPYIWDTALLFFELSTLVGCYTYSHYQIMDTNEYCGDLTLAVVTVYIVICVIYEISSFTLNYLPLRFTDGLFGKCLDDWANLITTANQQLDEIDDNKELDDDCPTLARIRSRCQISKNSLALILKFHKNVRRNCWAGVAIVFTSILQDVLVILFLMNVAHYINVQISVLSLGVTFLILTYISLVQYIAMMMTENFWHRAFIPFVFWHKKPWVM